MSCSISAVCPPEPRTTSVGTQSPGGGRPRRRSVARSRDAMRSARAVATTSKTLAMIASMGEGTKGKEGWGFARQTKSSTTCAFASGMSFFW